VGRSGDSALVVPPADPSALAAAIVQALDNPDLRARLGEGGRRRVLDRFTWYRTAQGTEEHYYLELEANARRAADSGHARSC
jgi:glycosyltransferase involved in cell wall biosynthesis